MKYSLKDYLKRTCSVLLIMTIMLSTDFLKPHQPIIDAAEKTSEKNEYELRMNLYESLSVITGIPWDWISAVDQYERTLSRAKPKVRPKLGEIVGVFVDEYRWSGPLNPNSQDQIQASIEWFDGIGKDGDNDGKVDRHNDTDLLYSVISAIGRYGTSDEDLKIGIWEYYQNSRAVSRIEQFHNIYHQFGKLDLNNHVFPVPLTTSFSYRDTWGDRRGWGGRRIHEGTDIFAGHGTPTRSTVYGIVEIKGWNRYGGWRIGIRDLNNYYHYYAHLSGFKEGLDIGQVVSPGDVIGWVGSSGYGKPGTSGKFPPHLHYGMYSDRGLLEWAFDPYPQLKRWELEERKRLSKRH